MAKLTSSNTKVITFVKGTKQAHNSCIDLYYSTIEIRTHVLTAVAILYPLLGWNDVGWNNPRIETPNLDRMAREGVILNSSYVQPVCTP